ncbi:MAG: hypothetical protein WCR23_13915 [Planctomycetota bacterium]
MIREYLQSHWNTLGGENFIALCTGVNLALLSWKQFQERLRHAEIRLEEKLASTGASIADAQRIVKLHRLSKWLHNQLRWCGKVLWPVIYLLAIVMTVFGFGMLYTKSSCPFDFLLLLPVLLLLAWSWFSLAVFAIWLGFVRKGILVFSTAADQKSAETAIRDFASSTEIRQIPKSSSRPAPKRKRNQN